MGDIINYIITKYQPNTIILYGSYANGSNNKNSDFDALVITDMECQPHDSAIVDGVQLDVFIYHSSKFQQEVNCEDFVQIFDGNIVLDKYGTGKWLKEKIIEFINSYTPKSYEENLIQIEWCEKMLLRTERNDAEGFFRWHWLLVDSLEIYCDICGIRYFGPKKSLTKMEKDDPIATGIYEEALSKFEYATLNKWVKFLRDKLENG